MAVCRSGSAIGAVIVVSTLCGVSAVDMIDPPSVNFVRFDDGYGAR
jgi:hypothetical protein